MKSGKPVINGWLQIPSTVSAEVMAHQGWDSLTIDMQHGVVDYPNALQMLQGIITVQQLNLIGLLIVVLQQFPVILLHQIIVRSQLLLVRQYTTLMVEVVHCKLVTFRYH